MNKDDKKGLDLSKNFWYVVIVVCAFLIVVVAIGFIVFSNREATVIEEEKSGGSITLNYTNNTNGLSILKPIPVTDAVGMKTMKEGYVFDFSLETVLDEAKSMEYEISVLKDEKNSTISDDDIRIYLEKENSGTYVKVFGPEPYTAIDKNTKIGTKKDSMVIYSSKKIKSGTDNYRLRMWISNKCTLKTGTYSIEVNVIGIAK